VSDSRGLSELPNRSDLALKTCATLNRGRWGNPDVLLVETGAGRVVVKDFAPRSRWVRRWLAPWLLSREELAYQRLAGVEAVPRLMGRLDAEALVIEYRPGTLLSRSLRGTLPKAFMPDLEAAIHALHDRGIVHLDLRHRGNILAGEDGRPVVIDFASALRFDPASRMGRGLIALFSWIDRRALLKWRARLV
jgi:serine/threonine protein kinase